jgi:hypothetical protein
VISDNARRLCRKASRLIDAAIRLAPTREGKRRCGYVQLHVGYAEPGYGNVAGDDVIATGDWNTCSRWDNDKQQSIDTDRMPARLGDALERIGVSVEWEDEWTECGSCSKLVRTQPDSYSWTRSYSDTDDGAMCAECLENDAASYLESLEGNENTANTIDTIHPENYGYRLVADDLERGFHPGQNASPKVIATSLRKMGIERFLFNIDSQGQFDTEFSCWVHEEQAHLLDRDALRTDGPSVSAALERGLREASAAIAALPPDADGVRVARINPDGTATARVVSAQDFIDGKALEENEENDD